ncbi:protein-L-isoaspartate O-methyltransferase [Patescibacteria group bacterium]|nr:protein-L-isoaspartate O-methyltransferase [Patescibacteria group bacterium]
MSLTDDLIKQGWLKTPEIIKAFQTVKREDFLGDGYKEMAEVDEAFPIGYGQTISQPLVVAFMLEKLGPKAGNKILDVGSGSGWTSALLAYIVSQKGILNSQFPNPKQIQNSKSQINGKVIAIEIVPELKELGKRNAGKYGFIKQGRLEFILGDGRKGYPQEAPFDRILCSASADSMPSAWEKQVKIGGKIVMPINNSICAFTKKADGSFEKEEYPGFVFVPLVEKE